MRRGTRYSVALAVSLGMLGACARNLVTQDRQFKLISEKTEIEIGRKVKEQIVAEYGRYHDIDWQIYLDQIGQKLVQASDRPDLAHDFTILDTDVLNAFAAPGGYIFVTRGIILEMADEAEFAIVLGHEITHVAAWHGVDMLQKAGLLATLTTLGALGGIALGAGEAAIVLAQAASIYESMYLLGYGRSKELEADQYGMLYAARAGYDPEAAVTFFERLDSIEKAEEAGQRISPYWRTHPTTAERLKKVDRWLRRIPAAVREKATHYNRDRYKEMVARLPQLEPAERGVVKARSYINAPFKLRFEVPEGWRIDNSRIQTLANFYGPAPELRGHLQRIRLAREMGVDEFGRQVAKQWGIPEVLSKPADYPAGHGLLWQYGGGYARYRSLLIVRGRTGYVMTCQMPQEQYLAYIIDCEKIMRSFAVD